MEVFETLTQLCLDIVNSKITPVDAYERILGDKLDSDAISSELIDVLVVTEPESESGENPSTSKANFETFVHLLANTVIPEEILRLELDCYKKDDQAKALIRLKTKVYFKQAKFNLFREESEGYSKLIAELMEAAESSPNEDYAKVLKHRVLSLIGQFNLDPNRVTDVILEVFENCPRQKLLFIALLKEIDVVSEYLCSLLGFKFTFYQSEKKKTPYSLYVLTASLIQHEMIDLMKILAFMIPKSDFIKDGHKARMVNAQERASKAETISTASMPIIEPRSYDENGANSMTTQTISFTTVIQLQEDEDVKIAAEFNEDSVLGSNQKIGLACALLESQNWKQAQMLIDRLPEGYAVQASPRLCRALCKIIERSINDFYKQNCSLNIFGDLLKSTKPVIDDMGNGLKPIESWEDLGNLSSVLWYLGPRIAFRSSTNVKLLRLVTAYYQKVEKRELPSDEKLNQVFVEMVSESLLPSLTLSDTNVALSEELWQLLQLFPYSWRYWMYSKWNQETARHPELNVMRGKIYGRTKYVIKRLSKETVKMMGRQLGKLCHVHPSTVLSYLLSQVQTFDNFIGPVVESLRYLTSLEFDVLTYCIISQLADPSKQALKSTDASISPWLQALGTLVGSLYRRYPLELNGMLDYVLNQLKLCKSYDMLLLREIIQNMSWIESISGATKEQIEALGGGDLLKQEAGGYSTATKNRKAAQRLRDALLKGDLAVGLCISIAQQKEHIIYNESSNLPLKLVGVMVDQCTDTFQQLISFLSVYLRHDEFEKRVPSVKELISEFSLGMEAAMCLARPAFFSKITDSYEASKKLSKASAEEGGPKNRLDTQQKSELFTSALETHMETLMSELRESVPEMEDTVPVKFFAIFWMLSMHDIEVPTAAYERTLESLKKQGKEDNHAKGRKNDKQLESKLREEQKKQSEHVEKCRAWLLTVKDSLIEEKFHHNVIEALLQKCLLPRALFSELDAVFSGQFFLKLHEMRTPFFPTVHIMDRVFENAVPLIAGLTENEANAISCFLEILLSLAQKWHSDKEIYEKECAGFPGMITKSAMEYQMFRKLCYRWQSRLGIMFKSVLNKSDADYVLVRNTLILMTKLTPAFPLLASAVASFESVVTKVKDREKGKRDDLSLMAASYIGRLKMRNVKIFAQNSDFANVPNKKLSTVEKSKKKEKTEEKVTEKAEGEPAGKKVKVDDVESKKNGSAKKEVQNGIVENKQDENKDRKKRPPVKTPTESTPKDEKKETEEGEVKTPSPPPAKKTRITDRLKRSEEVKKEDKEVAKDKESESEKLESKRKREKSRERNKEKDSVKEKRSEKDKEKEKERKKESGGTKKEPKMRIKNDEMPEVAGPMLPEAIPKNDDKKISRKAIEFDIEQASKSTSSSSSRKDRKEKKEENPKASRISEADREAAKTTRERGSRR